MGIVETAVLGAVGGVLPDIIRIIRKRFEATPAYVKRGAYWLSVGFLAIVGAVASVAAHAGTARRWPMGPARSRSSRRPSARVTRSISEARTRRAYLPRFAPGGVREAC